MSDPTNTPHEPDDAARQRFILLSAALGDFPPNPLATIALSRLTQWCSREDVDYLAELIRYSKGRAAMRHHTILAELADLLDHPHPMSTSEWLVVGVPIGLARRIEHAAREGS